GLQRAEVMLAETEAAAANRVPAGAANAPAGPDLGRALTGARAELVAPEGRFSYGCGRKGSGRRSGQKGRPISPTRDLEGHVSPSLRRFRRHLSVKSKEILRRRGMGFE